MPAIGKAIPVISFNGKPIYKYTVMMLILIILNVNKYMYAYVKYVNVLQIIISSVAFHVYAVSIYIYTCIFMYKEQVTYN